MMKKYWTEEDILRGRHYADLGEFGEFGTDTREPLEILSPWEISVRGIRQYGEFGEQQEEEIELCIELDRPLSDEEIEELSAGEIFIKGWRNFYF